MEQQILTLYQENNREHFLVFTKEFLQYFLELEVKLSPIVNIAPDIVHSGYYGKWKGIPVYVLPEKQKTTSLFFLTSFLIYVIIIIEKKGSR